MKSATSAIYFVLTFIFFLSSTQAEIVKDVPTYAKDVAKIIHDRCTSCHRDSQSAPFALTNYEEVLRHSETIVAVTQEGYMPPWKPSHGDVNFSNDRRLTTEQIDTLKRWVEGGSKSGNLQEAPTPPSFPSKWSLGEPDLVIKMAEPFEIPAEGPDIYRSFVLPVNLPQDSWIKAIEMRPSTPGVVHHALFFAVDSQAVRTQQSKDGKPGLKGMSFLRSRDSLLSGNFDRLVGGIGGYVPGAVPNFLPGDLAKLLPAGTDIVMQTHFHPTGKVEIEQSEIGIYLTKQEPSHRLVQLQLPPLFGAGAGIDIPAGQSSYVIHDSFTLPVDVLAHEVGGHAHYICRSMKLTATLPDGAKKTLLQISDWDLDWQDQYQFESAVSLPKGTVIDSEIIYDNSASNPENPHSPPQRITWGRESTDEMGAISLQLTAVDENQRAKLETSMRQRTRDSIRNRAKSQAGILNALPVGGGLGNGGLLKRLDRNSDGKLQSNEIPERFRDRALEFLDNNNDQELDDEELKQAKQNLQKLTEE